MYGRNSQGLIMRNPVFALAAFFAAIVASATLFASDPPPPEFLPFYSTNYVTTTNGSSITTNQTNISASFVRQGTNGQKTLAWTPYPAAQQYNLLSATNPASAFTLAPRGSVAQNSWK